MKIPLVFLHGFLGSPSEWAPVLNFLNGFNSLLIELPGHGNTPFTKDFISLFPNLPKIHLIGYSMGGRLAMKYGEAFPEKVATLTILSAHKGLKTKQKERCLIDRAWAKEITNSYSAFLDKWYKQPLFAGFTPDLQVRKNHNPIELAKTISHYSLGNQRVLSGKNALFLVGEKDVKYRNLYPSGLIVPDAGHMVHLENPEFVANVIKKQVTK